MDNERLIELVRERSFLYDIQDKRYGDNQKKDAAWRKIAQKLNTSDKECKKAWNNLRDGFRRVLKRHKETKSEQESLPIKKWRFEDELSFLIPYLKERPTKPINCTEEEMYDDSSSDMEKAPEEKTTVPITLSQQPGMHISNTRRSTTPVKRLLTIRRSRQFPKKIEPHETCSAVMMKYLLNKKEVDDIDTFFSSIASTVKTFPPRQRAIAKAEVFSVISKLEIEMLSQPSPISSPSQSTRAICKSCANSEDSS